MKRVFVLIGFFVLLFRLPAGAQDFTAPAPTTAASIAARENEDERFKRMAADIEALQTANEALQAKVTAMEQEIQTMRDAPARPAENPGVQDDLKHLAEKIQEVDKKREEDKQAISEEIRKSIGGFEKSMGGGGTSYHSPAPKSAPPSQAPFSGNGYSYTIQDGDSLLAILKAYNTDFKSKGLKTITLRQAREANPKVDWNRLRVGQKIVIPRPDGG